MAPENASGSLDTEQRGTKALSPTKAGATPTQSTPSTDIENEKETEIRGTNEFDSEESAIAAPIEYPKGSHLVLVTTALVLSVFLVALDQTIVGTAIPKITDEFKGLQYVSWYGTAYFMTSAGFQSSWGKVPIYFNLKYSFLVAMLVFELGSLICGVAPTATAFIVGRAIAGLGCAGITTCAMTIFKTRECPKVHGRHRGHVQHRRGMRASDRGRVFRGRHLAVVFYINLPVGGIALLVVLFFFHNPSHSKPIDATLLEKIANLDLGGVALAMGAIISLTLALEYGGQKMPWNSSTVIGLLVGFVAIGIAFVAWQIWQGDRGMIPPRVIKVLPIWSTSLFQFFFAGSYMVSLYYLPIYFQSVHGVNPIQSGVRNLPLVIASAIAILLTGQLVAKTQRTGPLMVFGSSLATVACGLFYTFNTDTSTGTWIGYQILAGAAWGSGFQMAINTVQAKAKPADLSTAISLNFTFQTFGGAFGIAAAQSAFVNIMTSKLASTAPTVDPATVILTGSAEIRNVFAPDQVPGIVLAYMSGLKVAFALMAGFAGMSFLLSGLQSWKKIYGDKKASDVAPA
ncbi:unnamed protein product [Clonostachys chloroleuca]|uniref:Major facilitator superfamily (MFS) profile domain-containing protein n=1 Tax=Clonostachys chloroleuca TaxID=1926264 RepID=A0AA35M8M1_9HYPO|nr:unnamed protein product [Clonostachys chloroleuca]